MQIELSKEEAEALLRLIDMAVKSGGLQAAEPALFFHRKIAESARATETARSAPKLVDDKDVA